MGRDFLVHQRLREHRLVALVMAMTAITNHVDDGVFLEALTIFGRDPGNMHVTASTSSALTWKIGAATTLATSEQYGDERECAGLVVKPIWLLMTIWIVPPVL